MSKSNKKHIQSQCDFIRDHFGYVEVYFNYNTKQFVGEGIDGGYFYHKIKWGTVSIKGSEM